MNSRMMRWEGNVAHGGEGEKKSINDFDSENRKKKPLEALCVEGRIILNWTVQKWEGRAWAL
jgi:hypothetical protein